MPIFVFGSNLAGRHGKGAALYAKQHHGAIYGQGGGPQGNSYAIPTKDAKLSTLPLTSITVFVRDFIHYAKSHPELEFEVTRIGCGLAGYTDSQIAPMFADAPDNCQLPNGWRTAGRPRRAHMIEIEFVDLRSDRSKVVGPFPFAQITYSDVRVGENGDNFIATHHNGEWLTPDDNLSWSDFIVRPAS